MGIRQEKENLHGGNMKNAWFIGLLVIAILLSGCGTRPAPPATPATTPVGTPATMPGKTVDIKGSTFDPVIVNVPNGTTVTWINDDSIRHTVTSVSSIFDSGNINPGKMYSYTFNQAGTFEYSCTIHPSITHGKVIVT